MSNENKASRVSKCHHSFLATQVLIPAAIPQDCDLCRLDSIHAMVCSPPNQLHRKSFKGCIHSYRYTRPDCKGRARHFCWCPKTFVFGHSTHYASTRQATALDYSKPRIKTLRPHVNDAADAVTSLHLLEGGVDVGKGLAVGDELVDLEFTVQVVLDKARQLGAALDASEGASLPHTTGDKLERCSKHQHWYNLECISRSIDR